MSKLAQQLNKSTFYKLLSIYPRQTWMTRKDDEILELLLMCDTAEQENLIIELLKEFHFLSNEVFQRYLSAVGDFIVNGSGFEEDKCLIASLTYDDQPDSSQSILHLIKLVVYKLGWSEVAYSNKFGNSLRASFDNRTQVVFVDEFIGSGITVKTRMEYFQKNATRDCQIKFGFVAGMQAGLEVVESLGYEVFCPLALSKGITDSRTLADVAAEKERMLQLEQKLQTKINKLQLSDYSMGYNRAEALYSLEEVGMNTPNSVFPIFWWPYLVAGYRRSTLLTRFEEGL